jgi:hypothetical protein
MPRQYWGHHVRWLSLRRVRVRVRVRVRARARVRVSTEATMYIGLALSVAVTLARGMMEKHASCYGSTVYVYTSIPLGLLPTSTGC